ncbi:hypothetical protein ACHAPG_008605 [Botrytis cinerea]
MHQDDTSVAEGNSVDDIPEDPEPTTELSHPKHGTKNFSRANPSDTTHSPSKANRISKHATFLNTPNDYIIHIIHTQTPQFLTNNPEESSPNTTSESLETSDTTDNSEDTLEETPHHLTIYTSYGSTHKLFLKSTIDWNGLAQAHYTPEIETITTFLDHNEHYPHLYPSEPLLPNTTESHSSTLQTFFNSLEKSFPNSDFPTLQKAIDVLALEQGKTATNGAPSFVLLYALRAQIWYSGVTMRDAWVKFQDHGFAICFRGFEGLVREAGRFREGEAERFGLLLGEEVGGWVEREGERGAELDSSSSSSPSSLITEIFATVLPHIYFEAYGWNQACAMFNAHLGVQIGQCRFRKWIVPVVAERLRLLDQRHTARIRRILKKQALRTGVRITPKSFCGVFNEMTGFKVEELVLRDVQNWLVSMGRKDGNA